MHQSLKGAPWGGCPTLQFSVRHLMGQPLYCSAASYGVLGGESPRHPLRVTQQYRLSSMAAWLSSTGIPHHSLLPHIPLIHLSEVNSSPRPGIAPQSLNSSSEPLHLPGAQRSCSGYVRLQQGLPDSHSIQAATDQLLHSQP